VKPLPRWRIAAALVILAGLALVGAKAGPIYIHHLQLQSFVGALSAGSGTMPQSDEGLRGQVLERAQTLNLPVRPSDVKIVRAAGSVRIEVRYQVALDLAGYKVNLHFNPGIGSR
jgi:hypothetical protein